MKVFIGVDVGSVSTNVVVVDSHVNVLFDEYIRTNGQPLESIKRGFADLNEKIGIQDLEVAGVGTTGSGRQLAALMIGSDVIKNEITAHASAALHFHPEVHTIFEIGGQDSKIIILKDGMVVDFSMNTVCAAGTGSFLDHQSERLGIPIQDFGALALTANTNVRIAGRCTVFAESDMIAKQQFGFSKAEIIKGLCDALVRNYMNNLGRGKRLEPPFLFQGGVAANVGIRRAFETELGQNVIIPKHYSVMGSIGAAILALENHQKTRQPSKFRGFDLINLQFTPSSTECSGCSNMCEVVRVDINGKTVAMWGDKCGKWANSLHQQHAV